MILKLENLGIISSAEMRVDGLTVITGENNTGKSTIGRSLYAACRCCASLNKNYIVDLNKKTLEVVSGAVRDFLLSNRNRAIPEETFEKYAGKYLYGGLLEEAKRDPNLIIDEARKSIEEMAKQGERAISAEYSSKKQKDLTLLKNDVDKANKQLDDFQKYLATKDLFSHYAYQYIEKELSTEFFGSFVTKGKENNRTSVVFSPDDNGMPFFEFSQQGAVHFHLSSADQFVSNVFLIDDAEQVVDLLADGDSSSSYRGSSRMFFDTNAFFSLGQSEQWDQDSVTVLNHKSQLVRDLIESENNLLPDSNSGTETLRFLEALRKIEPSFIEKGKKKYQTSDGKLDIRSMATGSKTFALLYFMLKNGLINKRTVLILDEPEVHLHPKWQNDLSGFLVSLVKDLGVTVLLTTHSLQFCLGLYKQAQHSSIMNKCNFYQGKLANSVPLFENKNNSMKDLFDPLVEPFLVINSMEESNKE